MAIGADDISNASWIIDLLKIIAVPASISLAAVGAAFRLGSRVSTVENASAAFGTRVTALETRTETLSRDHNNLAIAVAALPTRVEIAQSFESLKTEVRASRNA